MLMLKKGFLKSNSGKPEMGGYTPKIGEIVDETTTDATLIIPFDEIKLLLLPSNE